MISIGALPGAWALTRRPPIHPTESGKWNSLTRIPAARAAHGRRHDRLASRLPPEVCRQLARGTAQPRRVGRRRRTRPRPCPLRNALTAGIPWIRKRTGSSGFASTSTLASSNLTRARRGRALEHRAELQARATPAGPEVDHHGQRVRALDYLLLECVRSDVHLPSALSIEWVITSTDLCKRRKPLSQPGADEVAELGERGVGDPVEDRRPAPPLRDDPLALELVQVLRCVGEADARALGQLADRELVDVVELIQQAQSRGVGEESKPLRRLLDQFSWNAHVEVMVPLVS